MLKLLITVITFVLLAAACGSSTVPSSTSPLPATTSDASTDRTSPPLVSLDPVPRSQIVTTFGEPLSSGLSLPDMVENALRSLVEIRTGSGGGSGFIVGDTGLIVTNLHVVQGVNSVSISMVDGSSHTASVVGQHPTRDLAYLTIDSGGSFTPIAIGDSDAVRVGESVIVIGFPISGQLGSEPTVSQGIISAKRDGFLQTDAPINPGNSGGPMLDHFGNVVGVVVARVEESGGRAIAGIGFAIPVNEVSTNLGGQVTPGDVLPTPTPFPTIGPTPDIETTKTVIEAVDAQLRLEEQATRTAIEAQEEAERYAASLEATRVAELPTATPTPLPTTTPVPTPTPLPTATPTPTPTPTPEPTPTPLPTSTPHPSVYCEEWEAMVLDWIRGGGIYYPNRSSGRVHSNVPDHPHLSAEQAHGFCIIAFPIGMFLGFNYGYDVLTVGTEEGQLLPGTYKYRAFSSDGGGDRVNDKSCYLRLNYLSSDQSNMDLEYGKPFEFTFHTYHGKVYWSCEGLLYRTGD